MRIVLQWLGGLFVLGLCGAAVAALTVVKDRIRVVVQADRADTGPDPLALLRDDVATLQRELGELRTALGANFEQLGNALEARAESRHEDVRKLGSGVATLERSQAGVAGTLQGLANRLMALEQAVAAVAARPAAAVPEGAAAVPVVAPPTAVAGPTVPPVEAPAVPPIAEPPAAPPAKKPGFLSFSVPTSKFPFGELQDYSIVADLSRVGFDAKSTLHDFSGVTSKVAGSFRADFDDPQGAWTGRVTCAGASLATGVEGRDEGLREHLATTEFPELVFDLQKFEPTAVDAAKWTASGTVVGTMTIRGKAREVRMPVEVKVDEGRRVLVEGQMPLKLSDYAVPVPSQLGGAIQMEDEVKVWISLRARLAGGGRK